MKNKMNRIAHTRILTIFFVISMVTIKLVRTEITLISSLHIWVDNCSIFFVQKFLVGAFGKRKFTI